MAIKTVRTFKGNKRRTLRNLLTALKRVLKMDEDFPELHVLKAGAVTNPPSTQQGMVLALEVQMQADLDAKSLKI